MFDYFTFRFKQLFRYLSAAGGNLFILAPFALILLFYLNKVLTNVGVEGTQLMVGIVMLSLGLKRKDTEFLSFVFKNKTLFIFLIEYLTLYLFLELFALSVHSIDFLMILPLLIIFTMAVYQSIFKRKVKKFYFIRELTRALPLHAFEWRSGIRQSPLLFLSSYVVGIILLFFFPITPIMMLYWMTFSGEFYAYIEAREIIQSYRTHKYFYKQKIKSILLACNLLFLPHYILFIFLYTTPQIQILLGCAILFNMVLIYAFLLKYTVKTISTKVQNTIPITLYFILTSVLPVSLYLLYKVWKKNRENLRALLN